jgi:hypothetical protein
MMPADYALFEEVSKALEACRLVLISDSQPDAKAFGNRTRVLQKDAIQVQLVLDKGELNIGFTHLPRGQTVSIHSLWRAVNDESSGDSVSWILSATSEAISAISDERVVKRAVELDHIHIQKQIRRLKGQR